MEEVSVLGQILLPVGGSIGYMDYISWQNRCWLVPHWLEAPNGDRTPLRLVAPKMAAGYSSPPGPDVLEMFRNMPLPQPTYDQGHIPADLANVVLIIESPPVVVRA